MLRSLPLPLCRRRVLRKLLNRNLLWNGTIYRQQKRWDDSYSIQSNPVHDDNFIDYYDFVNANDMITSFSNPNYNLDAINSNLFSLTSSASDSGNLSGVDLDNVTPSELDNVAPSLMLTNPFLDLVDNRTKITDDYASVDSKVSNIGQTNRLSKQPLYATHVSVGNSGRDNVCSANLGLAEPTLECKNLGSFAQPSSGNMCGLVANDDKRCDQCAVENSADYHSTLMPESESKDGSFCQDVYSPDSNDSGIQADVTSRPKSGTGSGKTRSADCGLYTSNLLKSATENIFQSQTDSVSYPQCTNVQLPSSTEEQKDTVCDPPQERLPNGWQKHEDSNGAYYWHIKSGTIQREPPTWDQSETQSETGNDQDCGKDFTPDSSNSETLKKSHEIEKICDFDDGEYPMRFAVRSLGWVQISEDDLVPEKSSRSVNKCIVGLSLGKNDLNDVVGRWGDGKSLFMELDEENLILIDPQDMTILNIQPVQSIRVWGVGRNNGRRRIYHIHSAGSYRDFAYVARDSATRKHMCHVFRCDGLARHIASALRDVCKKILAERNYRQQQTASGAIGGASPHHNTGITRPNNLPNLGRVAEPPNGQHLTFDSLYKNTSFPTPMEEPKKVLRCHYLGTTQVSKPTGIEVLNNAIEKMYTKLPPDRWTYVSVAVAPSTITITEHGKPENVFAECRVRFLSFMGIAINNIRLCAFIMHCAQDQFLAHVFHCDPSAGALCKTIEAACKLRYQKCLDAHRSCQPHSKNPVAGSQAKGLGVTIRQGVQNMIGNLTKGCKPKSQSIL